MKVNIKSTILNKVLKIASSVISSGHINPLYDCILIKADQETNSISFISLNDSVKFKYVLNENLTVNESGVIFLKFRNLEAIISKLTGCDITLELIDTTSLRITKENFESNINILDERVFIDIDFEINENWDKFILNSNLFTTVEKKLFHCCLPKLEKISHLNGIYFDSTTYENEIYISSTDSYKVAMLNKPYEGIKFKLILETDLIKFINSNIGPDQEISFFMTNSNLFLKWGNITLITKINSAAYPNIYNTFNLPENHTSFNVNSNALYNVVERGNFIVASKKSPIVGIKTINPQLEISYKSTDIGSSFENIGIENFNGIDFNVILNSKYLITILKAFDGHQISFNYIDPNRQIILKDIEDSSFKQLLLPLRIT
ncbi:MAG: hypothetical protein ACRC4L_01900 [Mycoplasma sp.]